MARLPAADLKKPLKVKFRGEEGIDAGGVKKEFFQVTWLLPALCFVLFYFVLFYFVLFCFILFYFVVQLQWLLLYIHSA